MGTPNQHKLPKKRKTSFVERIDKLHTGYLLLIGVGIYCLIVVMFSGVEFQLMRIGAIMSNAKINGFWDLAYFNFISILSIGYGDISPTGGLRWVTIAEAIIGLGVYSSVISIITIKILIPREDTIVFSKYAYFCTKKNAFMIIYLNTAKKRITNLETSWYFKLNEDWWTCRPSKVPFITTSVQTFYLCYNKSLDKIAEELHSMDCLRVSLTGNLGMSVYSTSLQYNLKDIIVIPDRTELSRYPGFYLVDNHLEDEEFARMFHYCPNNAEKLSDYVKVRT